MLTAGSIRKLSEGLLIDTFDSNEPMNLLGGSSGTFSTPGTNYCQATVIDDIIAQTNGKANGRHNRIPYGGYWTALMAANVEEMNELSVRLYARGEVPTILVGLRHAATNVEVKVPLRPYVGAPDKNGWRTATIPLSAFRGRGLPNLAMMDIVSVTFENNIASGEGVVYLDDLQFRSKSTFATVANFDRYPMEHNLLGGGFRTLEKGAAAISADYHEDKASSPAQSIGTVRIAYGGTIGLDGFQDSWRKGRRKAEYLSR
jgi:hypothetical protein